MILLVDDDESVLRSYAQLLELSGYRVSAHPCPKDALKAFAQKPTAFQAIITDHAMPHISGLELIDTVQQLNPDIRPILFTGMPPSEAPEDVTVVHKPVRFTQILALLQ